MVNTEACTFTIRSGSETGTRSCYIPFPSDLPDSFPNYYYERLPTYYPSPNYYTNPYFNGINQVHNPLKYIEENTELLKKNQKLRKKVKNLKSYISKLKKRKECLKK